MSKLSRVGAVVAGSFVFGAADQYLGASFITNHLGFWTTDVSLLSAPWLALPFIAGARERREATAAAIGLLATLSALLGYFVLTNSPLEGVSPARIDVVRFLSSQVHVILPALATGPLFGWLGHRWRTGRSRASALTLAAAFCLEPLAVAAVKAPPAMPVALGEVALGLAAAAYLIRYTRISEPTVTVRSTGSPK